MNKYSSFALVLTAAYWLSFSSVAKGILQPKQVFFAVAILVLCNLIFSVLLAWSVSQHVFNLEKALLLLLSLAPIIFAGFFVYRGLTLPVLHDISTDIIDPPIFQYVPDAGDKRHQFQIKDKAKYLEHYGDLQSLTTDLSMDKLFSKTLSLCSAQGFTIIHSDSKLGIIEAQASSKLFRFVDDISIRIRATEHGSVLDMRSLSRVGESDLGANAQRIRKFMLALQMAGEADDK